MTPPRFREPFPILYSDNVQRLAQFYQDALGFTRGDSGSPDDAQTLDYVFLSLPPLGIGIASRKTVWHLRGMTGAIEGPPQFELCVYVDDVDRARDHLLQHGAKEIMSPIDQPWGERMAYFVDPDGNVLHIAAQLPTE